MKPIYVALALIVLMSSACSKTSDYTPAPEATAEKIFQTACIECHADAAPKIFELAADDATVEAVSQRILKGNMKMPAFSGIQGEQLKTLAEYVIANSATK